MAKRGWSLTDAQLERRKQNPAARRSIDPDAGTFRRQYQEHYAAVDRASKAKVRKQAMSRPSPARIAERTGRSGMETGDRQSYNRMTYGQADVSDLRGAQSGLAPDAGRAQQYARSPEWRGGRGDFGNPNIPTRRMAAGGPTPDGAAGKHRRQASTQAAYRAADASMFNSNVTPKAERVENKRPRSRMSPDQNVFW